MPKFTVHSTTTASSAVEVEISDEAIAEDGLEIAVASLIESGIVDMPSVCARCSGWGQTFSLEVDGEWNTYQVTDEDGKVVWGEGQEE